jgi:RNA polymerase sigma-70 factor (ECF subfamily)
MPSLSHQVQEVLAAAPASDDELLARVRRGERAAFAGLVRRYNQRLYRIVRSILRDDAEAEEVVQHVLVTAFHKLDQFRGDALFATWLSRIAINEAMGRVRARHRHGLELVDGHGELADAGPSPAEAVYHREMRALLEAEIDLLPDNLRVVLVLRDVQELDTAETASCLGLTEAAVRVRLHRARNLLQERLSRVMEAFPEAYRFAGARCDRMLGAVAAALDL